MSASNCRRVAAAVLLVFITGLPPIVRVQAASDLVVTLESVQWRACWIGGDLYQVVFQGTVTYRNRGDSILYLSNARGFGAHVARERATLEKGGFDYDFAGHDLFIDRRDTLRPGATLRMDRSISVIGMTARTHPDHRRGLLEPGRYFVQWVAPWLAFGSRREQMLDVSRFPIGAPLPFEVTEANIRPAEECSW